MDVCPTNEVTANAVAPDAAKTTPTTQPSTSGRSRRCRGRFLPPGGDCGCVSPEEGGGGLPGTVAPPPAAAAAAVAGYWASQAVVRVPALAAVVCVAGSGPGTGPD